MATTIHGVKQTVQILNEKEVNLMKTLKIVPIFLIFLLLLGCATLSVDITKMTPADFGALATSIYNTQYESHSRRADIPNLSNRELRALQDLKEDLVNIYPYLLTYQAALDGNLIPSQADRQALMDFVRNYYYKE